MERTQRAFADALWSGDSEQVNRAIDEVKDMEPEERAVLFDDGFELCQELYASGDGYQRQSAIRFESAVYPHIEARTVGVESIEDALPAAYSLEETARHRERLRELYLKALVDDDGRVRRAAAKAVKDLTLMAGFIDAENEIHDLQEELNSLRTEHTGPKRKHIQQAYDNVALHDEMPFSILSDALQNVRQEDRTPDGR